MVAEQRRRAEATVRLPRREVLQALAEAARRPGEPRKQPGLLLHAQQCWRRAVWLSCEQVALQGLLVGVEGMSSAEGVVQSMTGLDDHALDLTPIAMAIGIRELRCVCCHDRDRVDCERECGHRACHFGLRCAARRAAAWPSRPLRDWPRSRAATGRSVAQLEGVVARRVGRPAARVRNHVGPKARAALTSAARAAPAPRPGPR